MGRNLVASEHLRVAIEQAIARGMTHEQVAESVGVPLDQVAGVWAGMVVAAAMEIGPGYAREHRGGPKRTPSHGDIRGWHQHCRDNTEPCEPCKAAYHARNRTGAGHRRAGAA